MNFYKLMIGIIVTAMVVAMAYFIAVGYFGIGGALGEERTEVPDGKMGDALPVRQVLPPEIYLNNLAGSELIRSGQTKVLSGNINLTIKFSEPVNIEGENAISVENAGGKRVERLSVGYGGVDRKTVILNIPPSGKEKEIIKITIGSHVFFDEKAELRDPVAIYLNRYSSNRVDIKQIGPDGAVGEPEAWITEGEKAFRLSFRRSVNKESVERAIRRNAPANYETEEPEIQFLWNGDKEADVLFPDLREGTYTINLTGAEDSIGLRMLGDCGVGNCWKFNVAKRQTIKTYDMGSGAIETLEGKAFEDVRYLSGRMEDGKIMLHKFKTVEGDLEEPYPFEKVLYDEDTGEAVAVEYEGVLKGYYEPLLDKGWRFRGIKISPDGKTAAAFISRSEIGPEGRVARLLLIDIETETLHRDMEMPFYIYGAGDGVFPMDIHFDWTGNTIIFAEGFTMYGNNSSIYGINTETGAVVPLKKNAREPRFVPELKMLTAIGLDRAGEGKIQKEGEAEQTINYYEDSSVMVINVYGNEISEMEPIEGYGPSHGAYQCRAYDSVASAIWNSENKLAYPAKIGDNTMLLVQDLGSGEKTSVDMGFDFIFLGIKDGKAYVLEETARNQGGH